MQWWKQEKTKYIESVVIFTNYYSNVSFEQYTFLWCLKKYKTDKAIAGMCIAHLRAFIQQTNTHKHKYNQGRTKVRLIILTF